MEHVVHRGGLQLRKLFSELLGFISSEDKKIIGGVLGMLLFVLTPILVIGTSISVLKYLKNLPKQETKCWEVQSVDGRAFKVNTCTGETAELPRLPKSNASS